MELAIKTGCINDSTTINIEWFDHNNVRQTNTLEIHVLNRDKPRAIEILIDNNFLCELRPKI